MGIRLAAILRSALAAAVLHSALSAAPRPSAASETAIVLSATHADGKVTVEYRLPEGAAGTGLLYRSFQDLTTLGALDLRAQPISKYDLGPIRVSGRFVDSLAADGTAYWYHLQVKDASGRTPPCTPARVEIPPRPLAADACGCARCCHLFVDKTRYVLEVRRGPDLLKRYPVSLGQDPVRRKLHQDNATTPEGTYRISYLKPESQFHKAFGIDYPNAVDRERYARARRAGALPRDEDGPPDIGGAVQIHGGGIGNNWTWGCMAMRNDDIDELFAQRGLAAGTALYIAGSEVDAESLRKSMPARAALAGTPKGP